jgi:hypothetical protein
VTGTSPGSDSGGELGDPHPVGEREEQLARDLQTQPGLADAAGPDQRDEPVAAQQLRHLREGGGPTDQLRGRRRQVRRRGRLRQGGRRRGKEIGHGARCGALAGRARRHGAVGTGGPRAQDLLVQLDGLRLGRCAELPLQGIHAELVLAQPGLPAPEPDIEPHDRAVDGLLQRVQREQAEPGLEGRLGRAGRLLMDEQTAQALKGQLVQALPLEGEPLLERGLGQRQVRQQVTPVEPDDLLERGGAAVGDQPLEARHVHVHDRRVEGHARAVHDRSPGQDLPDSREGVAQVASGLGILHVSPQQRRQLLARVGLPEGEREVGQEGLGLPGGEDERSAGVELGLKAPQQCKFYTRRDFQCSSRDSGKKRRSVCNAVQYAIALHRPSTQPAARSRYFPRCRARSGHGRSGTTGAREEAWVAPTGVERWSRPKILASTRR